MRRHPLTSLTISSKNRFRLILYLSLELAWNVIKLTCSSVLNSPTRYVNWPNSWAFFYVTCSVCECSVLASGLLATEWRIDRILSYLRFRAEYTSLFLQFVFLPAERTIFQDVCLTYVPLRSGSLCPCYLNHWIKWWAVAVECLVSLSFEPWAWFLYRRRFFFLTNSATQD